MDGMRGYLGWRWIFILEGTLTCLVAILFFFLIPSFPEDAKWLAEDERSYVKARLRKDQGRSAAERAISGRDVVNVFKDFKIFLGGFVSVLEKSHRVSSKRGQTRACSSYQLCACPSRVS